MAHSRHLAALALSMLLPAATLPVSGTPIGADETLRFQVYLDDKPIGEHTFRITGGDDRIRVTSRAEFDVDFLFINAYRYRHSSREVFRNGCLEEIRATTDDNGTQYRVQGEAAGERFQIERTDGSDRVSGCVMTFAYWDPDFLEQTRLLNPQTGEMEPVRVSRVGPDRIQVQGRELPADRYALATDELRIDLWYNDDLGWVGLSSDTGKGRTLVYRRL